MTRRAAALKAVEPPPPPEVMLRPRQVAELLNLNEQTVRAMAARGDFPGAVRMGRQRQSRIRIPQSAVARWQAAQRLADQ